MDLFKKLFVHLTICGWNVFSETITGRSTSLGNDKEKIKAWKVKRQIDQTFQAFLLQ